MIEQEDSGTETSFTGSQRLDYTLRNTVTACDPMPPAAPVTKMWRSSRPRNDIELDI